MSRGIGLAVLLVGCGLAGASVVPRQADESTEEGKAAPPEEPQLPPGAVQDPLVGGPFPTLLMTQAWFHRDDGGHLKPGAARLLIWRQTPEGWQSTRIEDPDSNVFHEAVFFEDGILTIGAEGARLKKWTFDEQDGWSQTTLLEREWDGRFDRFRELEIGDVDHDGRDEIVLATHDVGIVLVYHPDTGEAVALDRAADTFVHEIEIGDIDGDGRMEFFASRTRLAGSRPGEIAMYRFDGTDYVRTTVSGPEDPHAKELLVADIDGDGTDELLSVLEAAVNEQHKITTPTRIRAHRLSGDTFTAHTLAEFDDRQARFLVAGDLNHDGTTDLALGAMKSGLWLLTRTGSAWQPALIDASSGGFEHVTRAADLDGDGLLELVVADDNAQELMLYRYRAERGDFASTLLGRFDNQTITWSLEPGRL